MRRRVTELRDLRAGLLAGTAESIDAARAVAQALRGSGATYGYPELSAGAGMVEAASDGAVYRRVEGLIEGVRALAFEDEPGGQGVGAEWLEVAAGGSDREWTVEGFESLASAWAEVCERHGLQPHELARRVAANLGLQATEDLSPTKSALRLVPEALIRSKHVLPLREDAEQVTVATADPSSLEIEADLVRITGRTPVFEVCPPGDLERGIARVFESQARRSMPDGPVSQRPPREAEGEERILVVDDDPPARVLARRLLEKGGYAVAEAEDGEEALTVLRDHPGVTLIVADLNMPRLDGLELIWEIRERPDWAGIPVIVVTGETDEILEAKLIEEGADDYIRKPLDPRLFLARVAATIRRAEH